jgi:hypothetical protein
MDTHVGAVKASTGIGAPSMQPLVNRTEQQEQLNTRERAGSGEEVGGLAPVSVSPGHGSPAMDGTPALVRSATVRSDFLPVRLLFDPFSLKQSVQGYLPTPSPAPLARQPALIDQQPTKELRSEVSQPFLCFSAPS